MSRLALLLVFVLLSACSESPTLGTGPQPASAAEENEVQAPLIARADLFGNPVKYQARISPDGQWLSWLAPVEGVLNIWVAPADDPSAAKSITADKGRGIPVHYWAYSSKHVLYTQDKGGNENDHVYRADIETGEVIDLTPAVEGVRATIEALSAEHPDTLIVGMNERNPQLFDLFRVTISTGEVQLLRENPGYLGWVIDNNLEPRLGLKPMSGGGYQAMTLGESPSVLFEIAPEDALTSNLIGINKANTHGYMVSSSGRDTAALVEVNLSTGKHRLLAADERSDVSGVVIDPATHEVLAWATNYLNVEWHGLTDELKKEFEAIQQSIPGDLQFLAATADGKKMVVYGESAQAPGVYYLYDRANDRAEVLFETRPALDDAPLEPTYPIEIDSRDGLTLVSYLTLPVGVDRDNEGIPSEPQPMVLLVHGGPWARDSNGYNAMHQWLANRGYAVLSVNYRGSTGFGKSFVNAAVKEFAGKMHDDLIDAVDWAVEQGIAIKDRTAIMGGSYGGYATLVGVTFTPDTFACGVDIVGPSNLVTLVESFPAYWGPALESTWFKYVGNPVNETDRADMFNRSPISRVDDIKVPLLIGQGENDPRVTRRESDQIVEAMREKNLPVTYLNYPDEGHGFARPENAMSFNATAEAFLSECLGGRFEPIGDDLEGSSVQVLHGVNHVPGLADAMNSVAE